MKIPKKIYEKIDTVEVAEYYNYPQMDPQISIVGKNKGSCETYDALLNIISDDIDTSDYIAVCHVSSTIDKDANKVTHCYHYEDFGYAAEFNSFEKLHDIMLEVINSNVDNIESINNTSITKNSIHLVADYSGVNEISASIHKKEGDIKLILHDLTSTQLDEKIRDYLLSEIKEYIDAQYWNGENYKIIAEFEIYESKVNTHNISWELCSELEVIE